MTLAGQLARYARDAQLDDFPAAAQHEALRSVLNWAGCAVGGSHHAAVERALAALQEFSTGPACSLFGRRERVDASHAALLNGMSAHVLDFDDTHLRTLLHPSVPVASALMALAERGPVLSGRAFLLAFLVGVEVECRIANAIWFEHNADWYITGTAGVFGAAAAGAKALALDETATVHALGLASAQAAGTREMAGTMTKSFIHGRAAQNGMLAALLARQGFTAAETSLEGGHGFVKVMAPRHEIGAITAGLGSTHEILRNSYKPYACGVVAHPVIDACIQLRYARPDLVRDIARVSLRVSPRAIELTGIKSPPNGLKSKWSIYHSAAVSLVDGAAGEHQYTDARVNDPVVRSLRERIDAVADGTLSEIEAKVTLTFRDGTTLHRHVERVTGSAENPMSDRDLEAKVRGLAEGILPAARTESMIGACWGLKDLGDAGTLARSATPA